MAGETGVGAAILRKEDKRFLTGKGNYVADIKRRDMTYGVFLRSHHAHAHPQVGRYGRGIGHARRRRRSSPAPTSPPTMSAASPAAGASPMSTARR